MKNYFIDKYTTIYNKKQFQEMQHVNRWKVPDKESAIMFIKAAQVHCVENPRGLSVYESYKCLVKETSSDYKIYYKQITEGGEIKTNV